MLSLYFYTEHGKKSNFLLKKKSRQPLESNYQDFPASFASGSRTSNAGAVEGSLDKFAKGKSKYFKTVLFTKSDTVLNSTEENSTDEKEG